MNRVVRRILASSRYFIVVAVLGSFAASATALVYGGLATAAVIVQTFGSGDLFQKGAVKVLQVELVTIIDLFLLGTVLYIIAVGLYELFVDPGLPMPPWLRITSLDDLKERLLGVVAVLLAVTFLGSAVTWDGSANILAFGLAVGLVLGVVSLTIALMARAHAAPGAPAAPGAHPTTAPPAAPNSAAPPAAVGQAGRPEDD
ncbi:MAG TPA: YqhA family protein [Chloroflexota bacterium]|nr:YqhA family protein [Chloroflexota bacterium]